jgi:hypothetical protein
VVEVVVLDPGEVLAVTVAGLAAGAVVQGGAGGLAGGAVVPADATSVRRTRGPSYHMPPRLARDWPGQPRHT